MSIRLRISLYISIVLFTAFSLLAAYNSYSSYQNLREEVEQSSDVTAERWTYEIMEELNTLMGLIRGFRFPLIYASPQREQVIQTLQEIMKRNQDYFGMWLCYEPNAYDGKDALYRNRPGHDGTGRFIPYLNRARAKDVVDLEALRDYNNTDGTGDFYQITKKTDKMSVVGPYHYTVSGKSILMISLVVPISVEGSFYGAAGMDIDLKNLQERIGNKRPFRGKGHIALISPAGLYAINGENPELHGKKIPDEAELKQYLENSKEGKRFVYESGGETSYYFPFHIGKDPKFWTLMVSIPNSVYYESIGEIILNAVLSSFLILVVVLLSLNLIFDRLVSSGLLKAIGFSDEIAKGNLTVQNDYLVKDEIGTLFISMDQMRENLLNVVKEMRSSSEKLSSKSEEMAISSRNFADIAQTQASAAEESSAAVEELAASAQNVGKSMEKAVENTKEIDGNSMRLKEQIISINQEMQGLVNLAVESKRQAVTGENAMFASTNAMGEIGESASRITEILSIITEISEKTNLLALNAAIEAARAGEAGKGFAVVAEEIGKLASQTSSSVQEIGELVESTNDAVMNGNSKVEEASLILKKLKQSVNEFEISANKVLASVKDQESNTSRIQSSSNTLTSFSIQIEEAVIEQKNATNEITKTIISISEGTQEIAGGADDLTTFSGETQMLAEQLSKLIEKFKVD
ncbi:methyl-accepting chemotaxis protein [Leptospira licerasiae]|uniref:methyl-accepting chemotaxis protein n=1 Tax=Leptospira licerasiae TaxID=447106 RepID=UPI003015D133